MRTPEQIVCEVTKERGGEVYVVGTATRIGYNWRIADWSIKSNSTLSAWAEAVIAALDSEF